MPSTELHSHFLRPALVCSDRWSWVLGRSHSIGFVKELSPGRWGRTQASRKHPPSTHPIWILTVWPVTWSYHWVQFHWHQSPRVLMGRGHRWCLLYWLLAAASSGPAHQSPRFDPLATGGCRGRRQPRAAENSTGTRPALRTWGLCSCPQAGLRSQ